VRLPRPDDAQVASVIRQVAEYIQQQRETYRQSAASLNATQMSAMQPFSPKSTLDPTRVIVLSGERVGNPPFYSQLVKMGFEPATLPNFSLMTASPTSSSLKGYFSTNLFMSFTMRS